MTDCCGTTGWNAARLKFCAVRRREIASSGISSLHHERLTYKRSRVVPRGCVCGQTAASASSVMPRQKHTVHDGKEPSRALIAKSGGRSTLLPTAVEPEMRTAVVP